MGWEVHMLVEFFTGVIKTDSGEESRAVWARTEYGCTILMGRSRKLVHTAEVKGIVAADKVTSVDLPGLEREMVETIVAGVLQGGILEKPGIKGKDDAVLFVLLNEALQKLEETSRDEEL